MRAPLAVPVLVGTVLFLGGCDKFAEKTAARMVERGDTKSKEGEYAAAIRDYERALEAPTEAAEVHYKLALIYDDKLSDPIGAIHHFQRYLALAPGGVHAKDAETFLKQTQFKLRTSLLNGGTITQEEAARLKNENLALRTQLTELRAQPRQAQAAGKAASPAPRKSSANPAPGSRTYLVQPGDTLASISRQFYKSSARWKDIQDANFNTLRGSVNLKPGQTLVVP